MYRHMDGYPSGHGSDLLEFLRSGTLRNGLGFGIKGNVFNGMGCLAAQMVAHFKDGSGGVYLCPHSHGPEEWNYYVYGDVYDLNREIEVRVTQGTYRRFKGTLTNYAAWIEKMKSEE